MLIKWNVKPRKSANDMTSVNSNPGHKFWMQVDKESGFQVHDTRVVEMASQLHQDIENISAILNRVLTAVDPYGQLGDNTEETNLWGKAEALRLELHSLVKAAGQRVQLNEMFGNRPRSAA